MRWSIVRLIWLRELRDQLRDRRTIFMIAILPILLYPLAGFGVIQLASGYLGQRTLVGLVGAENLLPWPQTPAHPTPELAVSCLVCTPPPPGCSLGLIDRALTVVALASIHSAPGDVPRELPWLLMGQLCPGGAGVIDRVGSAVGLHLANPKLEYPPLIQQREDHLEFHSDYVKSKEQQSLQILNLDANVPDGSNLDAEKRYHRWLEERKVDLLLVVPKNFQAMLYQGEQPDLQIFTREKDETSRLVNYRVTGVLHRWRGALREVLLARIGLDSNFDRIFSIKDPERDKPVGQVEQENLLSLMVRVFPFILVMWSLAGALYPAVDLCAGEKERGTMETLLISPASREEIVWGKFLTIWVFSAATALLNLLSIAITIWRLSLLRPGGAFSGWALFWGVALLLPLSAFFSAICLAIGAYARSSKEGQYYLMPLFFFTMPLIFLTLAPGVELNPFYSMVPVTGVALLLQRLMSIESPDRGLWLYFIPVLAPMMIYGWLALRWAIEQFNREDVLFREAERLDLGLWLRRLLREKDAMPSAGEALFCFVVILVLRWASFGLGQQFSLLMRTGISQLAFVMTPPLFMAMLLTTHPRLGMGLAMPKWWSWPVAGALALLVVPPLAELTMWILQQFPGLKTLLELNHPLTRELKDFSTGLPGRFPGYYFLVLAVIPAFCEELAFRGFILHGLLRRFKPWTAILLSAFLFSLYQMNVFQFAPHFVFGVILGMLVVRTGSVLPAMLFHLIYNSLVIAPVFVPGIFSFVGNLTAAPEKIAELSVLRITFSAVCTLIAASGLFVFWRLAPMKDPCPDPTLEGRSP